MENIDKIVFRYFAAPKNSNYDLLEGYDATIYYENDTPDKESTFTVEFWEDIAELLDILGIEFEVYEKGDVLIISERVEEKPNDADNVE